MAEAHFQVTGMSCGHCENAIRDELSRVAGVTEVRVSAATGELTVSSSEPLAAALILAAVAEAGYEARAL